MKVAILSWTQGGEGGNIRGPDWSSVNERLAALESGWGTITLDGEYENERQCTVQVRFEGGNYLLTFGYEAEDDWVVRSYKNVSASSKEITILGDRWQNNCICHDPSIVRKAFNQFFDTGVVSDDLLKP